MNALLASREFWIAASLIAAFFYWLGRRHGGETPSELGGICDALTISARP
jgi:hypothetical protein